MKRHAQTYQMKWPDQLSQVKEKAQHNIVSRERKKACRTNVMRKSVKASPRQSEMLSVRTKQCHQQAKSLPLHCSKILFVATSKQQFFFEPLTLGLTHAGDDAVHRQPGRGVIEAGDRQALVVLLLLLEDESGVLLLGDVDVVAGVGSSHDVAGAGVQEDALVLLPLHSNQTHAIPVKRTVQFHMYRYPNETIL